MLWSLHNKIGQNPRFAMGTFLKSKTFNSDGYVTALIGAGIVKNIGYKTQGQRPFHGNERRCSRPRLERLGRIRSGADAQR